MSHIVSYQNKYVKKLKTQQIVQDNFFFLHYCVVQKKKINKGTHGKFGAVIQAMKKTNLY